MNFFCRVSHSSLPPSCEYLDAVENSPVTGRLKKQMLQHSRILHGYVVLAWPGVHVKARPRE